MTEGFNKSTIGRTHIVGNNRRVPQVSLLRLGIGYNRGKANSVGPQGRSWTFKGRGTEPQVTRRLGTPCNMIKSPQGRLNVAPDRVVAHFQSVPKGRDNL